MATSLQHRRWTSAPHPTRVRPEDRLHEGPVLDAEWWEDEPATGLLPLNRAQRKHPPDKAGHRQACNAYHQASRFYA